MTFAEPAAPATTATFGAAGSYVLRLTASDGDLADSDEVTIDVVQPGEPTAVGERRPRPVRGAARGQRHPERRRRRRRAPGWRRCFTPGAWSADRGRSRSATPASAVTTATFPAAGVYGLRLTASDGELNADATT